MDVQMPRMHGVAATREIKRRFPAACTVMVSDYEGDEVREAAFAAGATGYSLKSDLANLEAVIIDSLATEADTRDRLY
jgi:DNA-binding NarL/FixJ family response regulator